MKKAMLVLLIFGSLLIGAFPCFAATSGNSLVGSDEADEIMKDMDLILDDAKGFAITREDIELNMDKIIRDYVDIDIFKNNIKTADEMRSYLEGANYVYVLPVFNKEDGDYELTISRGSPLQEGVNITEEGKKRIKERAGRWCVPAIGACEVEEDPPIRDYQSSLDTFFRLYGINNSETFFVGGQTTNSIITAICFTEEGEKKDDGPYYIAMSKLDPNAKTKEEIEDAVFTYDEIKEYAWTTHLGGGGMGGSKPGSTDAWIIILIAAVVAAAAVVVIVVRKHKHYR